MLTVKLLLNIILSTPNAKFITIDIKEFYLNTPMTPYKYMRLKLIDPPDNVVCQYILREQVTKEGYIYT